MTSTVKVTSNNFPVLVETLDNGKVVDTEILLVNEPKEFYITTTRQLRFIDLEMDHPAARAVQHERKAYRPKTPEPTTAQTTPVVAGTSG